MALARQLENPVNAKWYRANEIESVTFDRAGVRVQLTEEESGQKWVVTFADVQAVRITTEECAAVLLSALPEDGAFFEVQDSDWIRELGAGQVTFLEESRHFVVGGYDELVEVVAWTVEFQKPEQPDFQESA